MAKIVLFHGWGSDSRIWQEIIPALTERGHSLFFADQHYTQQGSQFHSSDELENLNNTIIVAHSLGVMYAYRHIAKTDTQPQKILSIAGFTRFAKADNFNGVDKRIIERMRKMLHRNTDKCLEDFRANAQCPIYFDDAVWNVEPLDKGLDDLANLDVRDVKKSCGVEAINLCSEDDQIVSIDMAKGSFANNEIIDSGGHFLPLQTPQKCIAFIEKYAQ